MDAVWSAISRLYGEHGASQTWLSMIQYDMENRFAIIRVTNAASDTVRTAIAMLTTINTKPASIHVIGVSGTIKALNKRIRQHPDHAAYTMVSDIEPSS